MTTGPGLPPRQLGCGTGGLAGRAETAGSDLGGAVAR